MPKHTIETLSDEVADLRRKVESHEQQLAAGRQHFNEIKANIDKMREEIHAAFHGTPEKPGFLWIGKILMDDYRERQKRPWRKWAMGVAASLAVIALSAIGGYSTRAILAQWQRDHSLPAAATPANPPSQAKATYRKCPTCGRFIDATGYCSHCGEYVLPPK